MLGTEIQHQRALARHAQEMDTDKVREHPAGRGVLDRLPRVVGQRGLLRLEGVPDTVFQRRLDEHADGHDHQEGHDPLWFLEIERRRKQERILQKPEASLGLLLPCIPFEACQ